MTITELLKVVATSLLSDLLEQLVASLLASSTLLRDDNNLFQTCQQLHGEQAVRTHLADKLWDLMRV
jgi:hypothetical protein